MTAVFNAARYEAARAARIKENRRIGNARRWFAGNADAQRVHDFLMEEGDFAPTYAVDAEGDGHWNMHPHRKAALGEFFGKMYDSLIEWGSLSDAQTAAVARMIDKAAERIAEREAAKQEKRDTAKHIGVVGERRDFDLTVVFTTGYETQFGFTVVFIMEDVEQNVVVYKGSSSLRAGEQVAVKGDRVTLKATIKDHTTRDGVAQTIIARPKQK